MDAIPVFFPMTAGLGGRYDAAFAVALMDYAIARFG
jgi:hypothetical protein